MCPACLASIAMLVSGGALSSLLVWTSRAPGANEGDEPKEDDDELDEDRFA